MAAVACITICPPGEALVLAQPPSPCGCDLPWLPAPLPPVPVAPTAAAQTGPASIRITFSGALSATPQVDPAAFTVALTGAETVHVVTASISAGNRVVLVLSGPAVFTAGTVTYAPTGIGDLISAGNGMPVAGFTSPVTPL